MSSQSKLVRVENGLPWPEWLRQSFEGKVKGKIRVLDSPNPDS